MELTPSIITQNTRKSTKKISDQEKVMIVNLHNYVKDSWPKDAYPYKSEIVKKTCSIAGISTACVYRILKQHKTNTPFSAAKHTRLTTIDKMDNFEKSYIRKTVQDFYYKGELPTMKKVMAVVCEESALLKVKNTTLRRILTHLNFKCLKGRKHLQNALVDTHDMALSRIDYLNKIKMFRNECRMLYFIDEICLKTGPEHSLYILHIGNENGFVGSSGFIETTTINQHHLSKQFENWFESIIGSLEQNSVVILAKARHHCRLSEKRPTYSWKKEGIQQWLSTHNISYSIEDCKTILLDKAKAAKGHKEATYVDEIAKSVGIEVLRLPQYHMELNPVELVWADFASYLMKLPESQIKDLGNVKRMLEDEIRTFTNEKWTNCFSHVIKEEERLHLLDAKIDDTIDAFEVAGDHLTSESDTVSCSETDESE